MIETSGLLDTQQKAIIINFSFFFFQNKMQVGKSSFYILNDDNINWSQNPLHSAPLLRISKQQRFHNFFTPSITQCSKIICIFKNGKKSIFAPEKSLKLP